MQRFLYIAAQLSFLRSVAVAGPVVRVHHNTPETSYSPLRINNVDADHAIRYQLTPEWNNEECVLQVQGPRPGMQRSDFDFSVSGGAVQVGVIDRRPQHGVFNALSEEKVYVTQTIPAHCGHQIEAVTFSQGDSLLILSMKPEDAMNLGEEIDSESVSLDPNLRGITPKVKPQSAQFAEISTSGPFRAWRIPQSRRSQQTMISYLPDDEWTQTPSRETEGTEMSRIESSLVDEDEVEFIPIAGEVSPFPSPTLPSYKMPKHKISESVVARSSSEVSTPSLEGAKVVEVSEGRVRLELPSNVPLAPPTKLRKKGDEDFLVSLSSLLLKQEPS